MLIMDDAHGIEIVVVRGDRMNAKNKLIERLLIVARKHKVLTYPVLALVAIISFFSYFFSWSHGAGKRIIAIIMVMVMLVSQSYFLTTSATSVEDDSEAWDQQLALQNENSEMKEEQEPSSETVTEESNDLGESDLTEDTTEDSNTTENTGTGDEDYDKEEETIPASTASYQFYYVTNGEPTLFGTSGSVTSSIKQGDRYVYDVSSCVPDKNGYTDNGCYELSDEWYYDPGCTIKVEELSAVLDNMNGNIRLYCQRILMYYRVTVSDAVSDIASDTHGTFQVNGEDSQSGATFLISRSEGMNITSISRAGYIFDGAETANGTVSKEENSVHVSFRGTLPSQQVVLKWVQAPYTIQYSRNEESADDCYEQSVMFDGSAAFLSGDTVGVAEKDGYKFKGWKIGIDGSEVEAGDAIKPYQSELYQKDIILYPQYEYDGIKIEQKDIHYEFDVSAAPIVIKGSYATSKADNSHFKYEIIEGSNALASKGITATATEEGILITTDGPTGVTATNSPIVLTFNITDVKAPEDTKTATFSVNVHIDKRKVTITKPDSDSVNKTYDGTTDTNLGLQTLYTDVPGITVTYGTARYNSPNVKDADKILLGDVTVVYAKELNPDNYEIQNLDEEPFLEGHILPRTVYVKTSAEFMNGRDYTRTGEENPIFKVEVDDDSNDSDIGFLNGDSIDQFEMVFSTDRNDMMQTGKYEIQVEFPADANYKIAYANGSAGKFEVKQENPELDVNYQIIGEKGNGGWYVDNLAVSPIVSAGYDTVRVSTDGGATYYKSGSGVNLEEKDSEASIQLYDSKTGAVTSWKKIDERIDRTPPQYISYSISQGDSILYESAPMAGGLYFPTKGMLTFGTYFNRTVTVTVKYRDTVSGLSTLHYGLYGAETTNTALFGETDKDGYATATFEIYQTDSERAGEINFYATDIAGNKGDPYKLVRGTAADWSVELSGPVIEDFYVTAGKDQQEYVKNGSEEYYSNCTAVVEVQDTISGIYGITWYINDTPFEERISNTNSKQTEARFEKKINNTTVLSETGEYSVYAVLEDNAGNEVTTSTIRFKVDDEPPVINITSDYDTWQTSIKLEFDTYDTLSGVDYINVTDIDGNLITHEVAAIEDGVYHCFFEITQKGTYYIIAVDKAGNINKTEIHADKVSSEIPKCPDIMVTPENPDGNDGWYRVMPSVAISNITKADDDAEVTTKYQIWQEGEKDKQTVLLPKSGNQIAVPIPGEGVYNLKTWSESITGMQCADTHECQIKVDTILPKITYTTKGVGSRILVDFVVTDTGSGVDSNTIKVLHGTKEYLAEVEETANGYVGSFEVSETGGYSIQASDIAGNVAKEAAFTPMSMKVKAVTNISENSATIGANIIKGSFDIAWATLSYKKIEDKGYMEAESIIKPISNSGNVALSAVISGLSEATIYAYKVTAASAVGEVLEYEGYFRTLSSSETGIFINGTARYADSREGTVTVGLFKGNVCYRAMDINAGEEFVFGNVPDGNYNIMATDGTYSKTMRVLVKDGAVVYPETYIDLILSGKNTAVVITTAETPDVTADNMDSIFDYDVINFTDEDVDLIEVGGTVEFKLYATLMPVSNVSANEISAMYNVTDSDKIVGAYLDLSLYKIVTDHNGYVKYSKVTELANGANISVTIPLGEMSGKSGLEVIRIHDTGDSNYLSAILPDRDNNPSTYTVTTNQFSTYAVLYNRDVTPGTEDPDPGTEDPDSGTEDPTPGTEDPDPGTDDPNQGTEDPTPGTDAPNQGADDPAPGTQNPITEVPNPVPGTENPITEAPIPDPNTGTDSPATKDKNPNERRTNGSSVGSLRSSGTAQTGDETPIAVMGTMMMLSVAGIFVLKRKEKQQIRK